MNVQKYLAEKGVPFTVLAHAPTYDAQHLAQAVHVRGAQVAKTVLLRADRGYMYMIAVLPADRAIDFQAVSRALGHCQLELATEVEMANHCCDCEIGALPPFGSPYGMKTIMDESIAVAEEVVFEGNRHNEAIRLRMEDYRKLENPLVFHFTQPVKTLKAV